LTQATSEGSLTSAPAGTTSSGRSCAAAPPRPTPRSVARAATTASPATSKSKEVVIDDGVMRDRFVICRNPDQAERDRIVREQLLVQLQDAIAGSDRLAKTARAELAAALPAALRRYLRRTPDGLLRIDRAAVRAEENDVVSVGTGEVRPDQLVIDVAELIWEPLVSTPTDR
jgi:hypothetical protein